MSLAGDGEETAEAAICSRLVRGEDLASGDDDMTVQSVRIEIHSHFGVERTREITLDHHAAKALLAPRFYLGAELLIPIDFERIISSSLAPAPGDGDASIRHRKRSIFLRIDCELVQCEAKVLRRSRFERDRRFKVSPLATPRIGRDTLQASGGLVQIRQLTRARFKAEQGQVLQTRN